jgi:phospholipase C
MSGIDRRSFLRMAASSAGAIAAVSTLPPAIRDALAIPAATATGTINDVEHVVIFMQENRAFDHYYGSLMGVRGFADRTPAPLPNGNNVWHQPYSGNADGYILPFHTDTAVTSAICESAPAMNYPTDIAIWNHAKFDSWNTARSPGLGMGYFTRNDLPYYYALADAFTICDHYFCSTLTQTNPNRLHLFSGSNGLSVGKPAVLDNTEPTKGFTWTTYAERLQTAGINWKVYQQSNNFDDNALAWFGNFKRARPGQPLHDRGMATVTDLVAAFSADVQNGTLPQVSWIVAPDYLSEHANYKPAYGEDLSARLLTALAANPQVWSKTVFLLNYDENGGFFDHAPPPTPPASSSDGLSTVTTTGEISSGQPIGFGFRVPMIVVSPWSRGGYVCSQVFDHTSVIRFLEQRFGVAEPNISAWRRAVSGDLTAAFDFANPNTPWPTLPGTTGYTTQADQQCSALPQPTIPATQGMPLQEKGTRPARALPYLLHADGRVDIANGKFWVDFDNLSGNSAAAVFHAYAANRSDGPWRYTVEAGKTLSDYWSAVAYSQGLYDVELHGPNGFLRRFKGSIPAVAMTNAPNLEVDANYDSITGAITLSLHNSGSAACNVTVSDNAYALGTPHSYTIAAGSSVQDTWALGPSGNWYDLSVTTAELAGYLRRYAGHIENGQASFSDPAMTAA